MQTDARRRIRFEGAINFRDLGGYAAEPGRQTRWNRVYRADNLAGLTEPDLTLLETLGLNTLIDFRLPMERQTHPDRLPPGSSIRRVELGFVPAGTLEMLSLVKQGAIDIAELERRVIDQYRLFCRDHVEEYRQMFAIASEPGNYPLLLHCTSGKDRTGFAVTLLLLAVGVPWETVLEDYSLTNLYRRPVPQLFGPHTSKEVAAVLLSAQPKYLEAAFKEIEGAYGSFDAYLERALAVDEVQREQLVETLTEPLTSPQAPDPGIAGIRPT